MRQVLALPPAPEPPNATPVGMPCSLLRVADTGCTTIFYDPTCEASDSWKPLIPQRDKFIEYVKTLPAKSVKMQPFDVLFMANPIPHEVTRITQGDRLCYVGFVGFEG